MRVANIVLLSIFLTGETGESCCTTWRSHQWSRSSVWRVEWQWGETSPGWEGWREEGIEWISHGSKGRSKSGRHPETVIELLELSLLIEHPLPQVCLGALSVLAKIRIECHLWRFVCLLSCWIRPGSAPASPTAFLPFVALLFLFFYSDFLSTITICYIIILYKTRFMIMAIIIHFKNPSHCVDVSSLLFSSVQWCQNNTDILK